LNADLIVPAACSSRFRAERFQISVPTSVRSVTPTSSRKVAKMSSLSTFLERLAGAEHGRVGLHDALHLEANLRRRRLALGVAELVEPRDGLLARARREVARPRAALDDLAAAQRRGADPRCCSTARLLLQRK
jgi:hypothetical protein